MLDDFGAEDNVEGLLIQPFEDVRSHNHLFKSSGRMRPSGDRDSLSRWINPDSPETSRKKLAYPIAVPTTYVQNSHPRAKLREKRKQGIPENGDCVEALIRREAELGDAVGHRFNIPSRCGSG